MEIDVVDWVNANFLPFESRLRSMLLRACSDAAEVDDVVQEVYYKLLIMDSLAHVREPKSFLARMAKNVVIDRLRKEAVINIDTMANLDELDIEDTAPTPERVAQDRSELSWVIGLISRLPERCKDVFTARRVYGLSQRETATQLGITEGIVEQEIIKGMHLMSELLSQVEPQGGNRIRHENRTGRNKHVND